MMENTEKNNQNAMIPTTVIPFNMKNAISNEIPKNSFINPQPINNIDIINIINNLGTILKTSLNNFFNSHI